MGFPSGLRASCSTHPIHFCLSVVGWVERSETHQLKIRTGQIFTGSHAPRGNPYLDRCVNPGMHSHAGAWEREFRVA